MFQKFFNHKTKNITAAGFILFISTVVSAILGLVRNRLLAGQFGAGLKLDIYFASLKIPSFIATVLVTGAISVAIIPLFNKYRQQSSQQGWKFVSAVFNAFALLIIALCVVLFIFAPELISVVMPGFSDAGHQLTVLLTRIMLLHPILLGFSTIVSGVLQSFYRFTVTALAPIAYNLGIIGGILFLYPLWGLPGLAWGVVLGSLLHLVVQLPALFKAGFQYFRSLDLNHGLKKMLHLAGPRSLSIMAWEGNLVFMTGMASLLAVGSIAVFHFASDFGQVLTRLIGVSLTTAAYPTLSRAFSKEKIKDFIDAFNSTLRQILYLIIPAGILFFILRAQIVRVILGTGQFDWVDTRLTAACAGIFSLGVFAQALVTFISKSFGALHDTKTPAWITFVSVALNVGMVFFFVQVLSAGNFFRQFLVRFLSLQGISHITILALPLSFVLMSIFQLILLVVNMKKKIGWLEGRKVLKSVGKIILATVVMMAVTYFALHQLAHFVSMQTFWGVLLQGFGAGILGLGAFLLVSWWLGMPEFYEIKNTFKVVFQKFNYVRKKHS